MDTAPWHAERSFLRSGWYENDSYSPVLPNLQRLPHKDPLPELASHSFKTITPRTYSAEVCRRRRADPVAEPFCRIRPLPQRGQRAGRHLQEEAERLASPEDRAAVEAVDSPFFESAFGDEAKLAELLASAPATECLRLASHLWLSPEFLATLGRSLPRLQELSLRNTRATDTAVAEVAAGCPDLRILDLGECALLQSISRISELRELRELRLPRCIHAVTTEFVSSLQAATNLEVLDLSFCPNLASKGLQDLATGVRALRWLSLTSCKRVGDEGVLAILSQNAGIEHLALALNSELTDHTMSKAVRCLRRLRHLDLSGCPQLFHLTPSSVGKHCEYIEDLVLASCAQMGDDALKQVFMRCAQLQSLDISGCHSISSDVILEGLPLVPNLKKLVLSCVPSVSDEFLYFLSRQYPNCEFMRHTRRHVDPDDLSVVLRMPAKGSTMVARPAGKAKLKKGKTKKLKG